MSTSYNLECRRPNAEPNTDVNGSGAVSLTALTAERNFTRITTGGVRRRPAAFFKALHQELHS